MPRTFEVTDLSPLLAQDAHCIYCHTDIVLNDHVTVCDSCRSPHHVDCWQANGSRCATFGCAAGAVAKRTTSSGPVRPIGSAPPERESSNRRIPWGFVIFAFFMFSSWCSNNGPVFEWGASDALPTSTPYPVMLTRASTPAPTFTVVAPAPAPVPDACKPSTFLLPLEPILQSNSSDGSARVEVPVTVSNLGDVALTNIKLSHPQEPSCDGSIYLLAAGDEYTYFCSFTPVSSDEAVFEVWAVTDENQCEAAENLRIVTQQQQPEIAIADVCEPPALLFTLDSESQADASDGSARVEVSVTLSNPGDVELTDIEISHAPESSCDGSISLLAAGEDYAYTCQFTLEPEETLSSDKTVFEVRAATAEYRCEDSASLLIELE